MVLRVVGREIALTWRRASRNASAINSRKSSALLLALFLWFEPSTKEET